MKRKLVAALAAGTFVSMSAVAATDPTPEVRLIAHQLLEPAAQGATDAVNLAASDPAKACQMAKDAADKVAQAQARTNALIDKMAAEGQDTTQLAAMKAKLDAGAPEFGNLARKVCDGEIAKIESDPATRDITVKIGGYMKAYNDDVVAADTARRTGDKAKFCALSQDAKAQLDGLSAYSASLRTQRAWSPNDLKGFDLLDTRVAGFKATTAKMLAECPPP